MTEGPPLGADWFDQVTLLPCLRDHRSRTGHTFGAFARNGESIVAFAHPWCEVRQPDRFAPRKLGRAIYGGLLADHVGHFLLEAMAHLWFIRAHPELPVLWHEIALPVPHSPWPGLRREVWHLLGLDQHAHVMIRQPRRFSHVVVPHPGLTLAHGLHPGQASALAVVPAVPPTGERVWLSRTALPAQFGRLLGEEMLERQLADRGWIVLRPETMRVADQANVFARASTVAGFASSAFHAVLPCAAPRAQLRIVRRPSVCLENHDLIAQARGLNQVHIDVALRPFGVINARTTFELADPLAAADAVNCLRVCADPM